ncbi:MAG: TetR/AcrR family transcriptional regulator [bacterium]|nr:TetR/AcrR family transcriptional regulator [bacterium]
MEQRSLFYDSASQPEDPSLQARVVDAAAQVFAEKGFARASTRLIAAQAGVHEMTLLRQFGSKLNLLVAVFDHTNIIPTLLDGLAQAPKSDYAAVLLTLAHDTVDLLSRRRFALEMVLKEVDSPPDIRSLATRTPQPVIDALADYLRTHAAAYHLRPLDADVIARAFFDLIGGLVTLPSADVAAQLPIYVHLFIDGTRSPA